MTLQGLAVFYFLHYSELVKVWRTTAGFGSVRGHRFTTSACHNALTGNFTCSRSEQTSSPTSSRTYSNFAVDVPVSSLSSLRQLWLSLLTLLPRHP